MFLTVSLACLTAGQIILTLLTISQAIFKRFEPLNVKALVYVFPWKVTFKRKIHKLLLTVLEIEDDYVDAHSLILNFKNTGIELS